YAPRNDNDRMSLRAKRSNLNDCTEQDHFILLEALRYKRVDSSYSNSRFGSDMPVAEIYC
ncbi:MAG: hypothetical protein ACE5NM_10580, partial [Sedimentisphaerales bacterium]